LEHDSWITVELQHSLAANSDSFSFRGNVTIPSLNSGLANVEQPALSKADLDMLKVIEVLGARHMGTAGKEEPGLFPSQREISTYLGLASCVSQLISSLASGLLY